MTEKSTQTKGAFTVVHATDLASDTTTTLEHGLALARKTGGSLITLHVIEGTDETSQADRENALESRAREELDVAHHTVICRYGERPKKAVVNALRDNKADLLVVATRRQQENSGARSSVSEAAALNSPVPTLVTHVGQKGLVDEEGNLALRRILLPVGDGEEARDAVKGLTKLLDQLGTKEVDIYLLRVGDAEILEYVLTPERAGWRWHRETHQGFVADVIGEVSKDRNIDLVVMATRGKDGVVDVFSGTHVEKVIRRVARPLLVVPVK